MRQQSAAGLLRGAGRTAWRQRLSEELSATIDVEAPPPRRPAGPKPFDYTTIPPGHYDLRLPPPPRNPEQVAPPEVRAGAVRARRATARVLDVGCGPGTLRRHARSRPRGGRRRHHRAADRVRERVYGGPTRSFYACALEELPAELEPFDAVSADRVDRAPARTRWPRRRCATPCAGSVPEGRLVLTTPDFGSAWPLVEKLVDRLGDVEYYVQHINKFTRAPAARR